MARSIDTPGGQGVRAVVAMALVAGLLAGGCAATRLRRSLKTVDEVQTLDPGLPIRRCTGRTVSSTYTYTFQVPVGPAHELFLTSRGYYLEWMREEWLSYENPLRAAQLILNPEQLLRDIAPAFKRQEARMERLFWGSRYARQ